MGNCVSQKDDYLLVVNAIKGEAENGFPECASSNYSDILPVGAVNRLISRVNSAIQTTKSQKKFIQLKDQYNGLSIFLIWLFGFNCITPVVILMTPGFRKSIICWIFMGKYSPSTFIDMKSFLSQQLYLFSRCGICIVLCTTFHWTLFAK